MATERPANGVSDDLELARRARGGEWDAFQAIVDRHTSRIYGLAMRIVQNSHDAEDVTQQTFVSVIEHLDRFREESSLSTWILRIATNHALKVLRRRRGPVRQAADTDDYGSLPHPEYIAPWREGPEEMAQIIGEEWVKISPRDIQQVVHLIG